MEVLLGNSKDQVLTDFVLVQAAALAYVNGKVSGSQGRVPSRNSSERASPPPLPLSVSTSPDYSPTVPGPTRFGDLQQSPS